MRTIRLSIAKGLSLITGNPIAQRCLEWGVVRAQYLMGIGSGGVVANSGEKIALTLAIAGHSGGSHGDRRATSPVCVFDVGANIGQFSAIAKAVLRGHPYTIHCFEPGRHTFDQLGKNIGDDNSFRLNNIALGAHVGSASLFYDKAGSGIASMTKRNLEHFKIDFSQSESISVDTVDNYCDRARVDRIDLLKMDVEGHELDVLRGLHASLKIAGLAQSCLSSADATLIPDRSCRITFTFSRNTVPIECFGLLRAAIYHLLIHTGKSMSNSAPPISWCDFLETDELPRVRA